MSESPLIWVERNDVAPTVMETGSFEVVLFSRCDPGKDTSEDALFVVPLPGDSICVGVVDGMGGMAAGGQAARLTAESIASELTSRGTDADPCASMVHGFEDAHTRVVEACCGGGATAVGAVLTEGSVQFAHSGDAEALLFGQSGRLKHRTPAHSPVGHAQRAGVLSELEGLLHPERHLVSNAVGIEGMTIEVGPPLPLSPQDTVLLCSDGLTDNVMENEILEALRRGPLKDGVQRAVNLAAERMEEPLRIPTGDAISKCDDLTLLAVRRKRRK